MFGTARLYFLSSKSSGILIDSSYFGKSHLFLNIVS
nr:MAG TPA: hypothetical protein [Caudoviricetes sp.]